MDLALTADLFYWAMLKMHTEYDFTIDELKTKLQRHLDSLEHFTEKQLKEAGSYCRANEVVVLGWQEYLQNVNK